MALSKTIEFTPVGFTQPAVLQKFTVLARPTRLNVTVDAVAGNKEMIC
jgi:hypothetical protein